MYVISYNYNICYIYGNLRKWELYWPARKGAAGSRGRTARPCDIKQLAAGEAVMLPARRKDSSGG